MKKAVRFIVKDLDVKNRLVKFAFSKFDEFDADNDITVKGAFKKTMQEMGPKGADRIRHLYNHEQVKIAPIGKLQEMYEEPEFAVAVSKMLNHQLASDLLNAYEEKAIDEHSYWGKGIVMQGNERGGNIIKEVSLREVSTVLWGAQEKAKLIGFEKSEIKTVESLKDHLEGLAKWVKKSKASDEFLIDIESEILKTAELIETLELESRQQTLEKSEPLLSLADIYKLKTF